MARRSPRTRQTQMGRNAPPEHDSDDEPATPETLSQEAAKAEIINTRSAGLQAVSTSETAAIRPLQTCPASQDRDGESGKAINLIHVIIRPMVSAVFALENIEANAVACTRHSFPDPSRRLGVFGHQLVKHVLSLRLTQRSGN